MSSWNSHEPPASGPQPSFQADYPTNNQFAPRDEVDPEVVFAANGFWSTSTLLNGDSLQPNTTQTTDYKPQPQQLWPESTSLHPTVSSHQTPTLNTSPLAPQSLLQHVVSALATTTYDPYSFSHGAVRYSTLAPVPSSDGYTMGDIGDAVTSFETWPTQTWNFSQPEGPHNVGYPLGGSDGGEPVSFSNLSTRHEGLRQELLSMSFTMGYPPGFESQHSTPAQPYSALSPSSIEPIPTSSLDGSVGPISQVFAQNMPYHNLLRQGEPGALVSSPNSSLFLSPEMSNSGSLVNLDQLQSSVCPFTEPTDGTSFGYLSSDAFGDGTTLQCIPPDVSESSFITDAVPAVSSHTAFNVELTNQNGSSRIPGPIRTPKRGKSKQLIIPEKSQRGRRKDPCSLCKEHKGQCDRTIYGIVCARCWSLAHGDGLLGIRICYKDKEQLKLARSKIKDFFEMESRGVIPPLACKDCGVKSRTIKLIHPPYMIGNRTYQCKTEPLEIEVEPFIDLEELLISPATATVLPTEVVQNGTPVVLEILTASIKKNFEKNPPTGSTTLGCLLHSILRQYRIRHGSLPTAEVLIEWGSQDVMEKAEQFPTDLESAMDAFFFMYLKGDKSLPLYSLIRNLFNMAILARYLDNRRPIDHDLFQDLKGRGADERLWRASGISKLARNQLFTQAVKGIERIEQLVLDEIDGLLSGNDRGRTKAFQGSDPVLFGLCVRRLALHYRHTMQRYKQFGDAGKDRFSNARTMYDASIRHYARAFRGTLTPFHKDWDLEQHRDAFHNDDGLIARFDQLKVTEAYHYNNDLDKGDDGVYIGLFAEKINKKHEAPASNWKKMKG